MCYLVICVNTRFSSPPIDAQTDYELAWEKDLFYFDSLILTQ